MLLLEHNVEHVHKLNVRNGPEGCGGFGGSDRAKFIALINDLLAAGKSQMKGGSKR